jgi:hypothetical protein
MRIPAFDDVVKQIWNSPSQHVEPCQRLFHKLKDTGKALAKWGRHRFSNTKVLVHAALLVILQFDLAQESRHLSAGKLDLVSRLRRKVIALTVIEQARKKQYARIAHIKEGDANTKFFHLRVNARRRKNHIHRLRNNLAWVTEHEAKEQIVHDHYKSIFGKGEPRLCDFSWDELIFEDPDLRPLGDPFTEEEVKHAIFQMPGDKAPGPDGFTGAFFKRCWDIIKGDVM